MLFGIYLCILYVLYKFTKRPSGCTWGPFFQNIFKEYLYMFILDILKEKIMKYSRSTSRAMTKFLIYLNIYPLTHA